MEEFGKTKPWAWISKKSVEGSVTVGLTLRAQKSNAPPGSSARNRYVSFQRWIQRYDFGVERIHHHYGRGGR